ncbi:hypothetical protein IQ07DRAFT_650572 [Pyrenochaeta sp. DS3sAY3a]|nr:hypothetical protein IQ07DRAFT_650572 [Pyrenochaeta sp. DS3sAY3a]
MTSGNLVDMIETGKADLLSVIFDSQGEFLSVSNSFERGAMLLELFQDLGVDAHTCITSEISNMDSGMVRRPWGSFGGEVEIIFEQNEEGTWGLGWNWTFERYGDEVKGLLTEWKVLMMTFSRMEWPFLETGRWFYNERDEPDKHQEARFQRRVANKARKERARAGLKRPRSRMPGSWVH